MKKNIIVALAKNNAIGKDNQLLWHISEDLIRFKMITMGCPVIMGRKTYESIGKLLPGRKNIIITSQKLNIKGADIAKSLNEAYNMAEECHPEQCFIIGGGSIYKQSINDADKLYLTVIEKNFDAEVFFPEIEKEKWVLVNKTESTQDEKSKLKYHFEEYIKKDKN